ncbi:transcriptional activator, adenine-specific DNA methyltransferase [Cenarchaeum symbiosum A]|uniref:Transcriptional activator, adenine-specific DNA methyltransferase n=1 Tax=Cenarchaeum symbiosum (strain A) TaxID=414004 RepID=A0RV35_CENSY|nr:transcriptional activator, adenine-specific DNA methyltransferase [Cenarchaeum symbiosum A]
MSRQSSYSVYSKDVRNRTKQNRVPREILYQKLPNRKFDIIYADPPWDYNGKLQYDKTDLYVSTSSFKYPTMKTEKMMEIPIKKIASSNSLLFLWATSPHLEQAIQLGKAWGFEYRTVAFVWDKMNHNPGKYTLSNCELCLLFKHGKIPTPRGARNVRQLITVPRSEHSRKPVQAMQGIERMFPFQKKIELFAREKYRGWSAWGLDLVLKNKIKNLI